jgi:ABC-type proline/glycine betaine transport system permease subunit
MQRGDDLSWLLNNEQPGSIGEAIHRLTQYIIQLHDHYNLHSVSFFDSKFDELVTLLSLANDFPTNTWQRQVLTSEYLLQTFLEKFLQCRKTKFDASCVRISSLLQLLLRCLQQFNFHIIIPACVMVACVADFKYSDAQCSKLELMAIEKLLQQCFDSIMDKMEMLIHLSNMKKCNSYMNDSISLFITRFQTSRYKKWILKYLDDCHSNTNNSLVGLRILSDFVCSDMNYHFLIDWLYKQVIKGDHIWQAYTALKNNFIPFIRDYSSNRNPDTQRIVDLFTNAILSPQQEVRLIVFEFISCILSCSHAKIIFEDQFLTNIYNLMLWEKDPNCLKYIYRIIPHIYRSSMQELKEVLALKINSLDETQNNELNLVLSGCIFRLLEQKCCEFENDLLLKLLEFNTNNVNEVESTDFEVPVLCIRYMVINYPAVVIQYFYLKGWNVFENICNISFRRATEYNEFYEFTETILQHDLLNRILLNKGSIVDMLMRVLSNECMALVLIIFRKYGTQITCSDIDRVAMLDNMIFDDIGTLFVISELFFIGYADATSMFTAIIRKICSDAGAMAHLIYDAFHNFHDDIKDSYRLQHAMLKMIIASQRSLQLNYKVELLEALENGMLFLENEGIDIQTLLPLWCQVQIILS